MTDGYQRPLMERWMCVCVCVYIYIYIGKKPIKRKRYLKDNI